MRSDRRPVVRPPIQRKINQVTFARIIFANSGRPRSSAQSIAFALTAQGGKSTSPTVCCLWACAAPALARSHPGKVSPAAVFVRRATLKSRRPPLTSIRRALSVFDADRACAGWLLGLVQHRRYSRGRNRPLASPGTTIRRMSPPVLKNRRPGPQARSRSMVSPDCPTPPCVPVHPHNHTLFWRSCEARPMSHLRPSRTMSGRLFRFAILRDARQTRS